MKDRRGTGQRVLLVDGDGDSRAVYRIMLQHHGYEVVETSSGQSALELVEQTAFAAVIMELTLRELDGHSLLRELRGNSRTAELCVVVVTARVVPEERERAERGGCTLFLTKPIEPQRLVAEVTRILRVMEA